MPEAPVSVVPVMMFVEEATPFTVLVSVLPDDARPLAEITLVVALTPLIVVVKVFPVVD